jgi:hypothetical protein
MKKPSGPNEFVATNSKVGDTGCECGEGLFPEAQATAEIRGAGANHEHGIHPLAMGLRYERKTADVNSGKNDWADEVESIQNGSNMFGHLANMTPLGNMNEWLK